VEAGGSHIGMALNRSAWRAVADALDRFRRVEARRRPAGKAKVGRLGRAA
jgi:hypothetical protein